MFPFVRFPGATIVLGPEMRSTGEVMGMDDDLGIAFAKTQMAAKPALPLKSARSSSASKIRRQAARRRSSPSGFIELGFTVCSTTNTDEAPAGAGTSTVQPVFKLNEGRPELRRHDQEWRDLSSW